MTEDIEKINKGIQWHLLCIRQLVTDLILAQGKLLDDTKLGYEEVIKSLQEKHEDKEN